MGEQVGVARLSFAHGHRHTWCRSLQADPRARVVAAWDDDARGRTAAQLGVEMLLAAYQSAREGRAVALPFPR